MDGVGCRAVLGERIALLYRRRAIWVLGAG